MVQRFSSLISGAATLVGFSVVALPANYASAATIKFDDQGLSGPSSFREAGPAQTLDIATSDGNARIEDGVVLSTTANLPANQSSVYGTGSQSVLPGADPSLENPITATFENSINNFSLDVFNGLTQDTQYTVADDIGNSATFSLPPNLDGGTRTIGFEAAGDEVTIMSNADPYDFFIDNITFNEDLPEDLPEPMSVTNADTSSMDSDSVTNGDTPPTSSEVIPEPSSVLGTIAFGILSAGYMVRRKLKQV